MSERYSASTLTTTTLEFQFLRGGDAYDAYSVDSVSIYSSYADAQSESSPIQTITSSSITRVSTGLYQYEVAIISTAGTYFDKIFITPAVKFSLEEAMEYIARDEYLEVTPRSLRMRKIILDEHERKRSSKT